LRVRNGKKAAAVDTAQGFASGQKITGAAMAMIAGQASDPPHGMAFPRQRRDPPQAACDSNCGGTGFPAPA